MRDVSDQVSLEVALWLFLDNFYAWVT